MDHQDLEINQYIKNWADHQPLPIRGKAELITAAATQKEKKGKNIPQITSPITNDLISWAMVYCVDRKISLARIVT